MCPPRQNFLRKTETVLKHVTTIRIWEHGPPIRGKYIQGHCCLPEQRLNMIQEMR